MGIFISKLQFERAKYKNSGLLKKLDGILFPHGDTSLENMTIDKVNSELEKAFENRLRQGTPFGNICLLAQTISDNQIVIGDSLIIPDAVKTIINNSQLINEKYK